jgi:lactoylglutathione lyase
MQAQLTYAIKFVLDMDKAVAFYRTTFGLTPRFTSPDWSEFETGATRLALHLTDDPQKAGSVQIGFTVPDLPRIYAARDDLGLTFSQAPFEEHGTLLSRVVDCEGAEVSLSGAP